MSDYAIRRAAPDDVALITQTWVRGAQRQHDAPGLTSALERLLAARLVAGDVHVAANGDVILGYVIAQRIGPTVCVVWQWTKERYRRWGVATRLWRHATDGATSVVAAHAPSSWHRTWLRSHGIPLREALPWLALLAEDEVFNGSAQAAE